nr:carbon monoxide dehydrogenase subunit CooF [Carboxydothermus hydrogenoformans]
MWHGNIGIRELFRKVKFIPQYCQFNRITEAGEPTQGGREMNKVIFNKNLCVACHSCEVSCSIIHSSEKSLISAILEGIRPRLQIVYTTGDKTGGITIEQCKHCKRAKCIEAYPQGALFYDEEGRVVCSEEKCTGCGLCEKACPFHAIRVIDRCVKCDLCKDVSDFPVCVTSCPVGALTVKEVQ